MSAAELIVTVTGVGLIALIAWFFWAPRREASRRR
jgi:plastocyanin domain-containing protein